MRHKNIVSALTLGLVMISSTVAYANRPLDPTMGCKEPPLSRERRLASCAKGTLASIQLERCPTSICLNKKRINAFKSLTDLAVGQAVTKDRLRRGIKRLVDTGFFADVVPVCETKDNQVSLRLKACPNTFIRKTRIEGNRFLHRKELMKRIILRSGTVLNVDPKRPFQNEQVLAQAKTLRGLYQKEGLSLAESNCGTNEKNASCGIRVKITRVSATSVDVTIVLKELPRMRTRRIIATHVQTKNIAGSPICPRVTESSLKQVMGLTVGDVITRRKRSRIRRKLRFFFQSIGFRSPQILFPKRKSPVEFEARVITGSCWLIRVWERSTASRNETISLFGQDPVIEGQSKRGTKSFKLSRFEPWREALPFGNSGNFEPTEAARAVSKMRQTLQNRGYLFADVRMTHRRLKQKGPVAGRIDYYITRNWPRRIQGITLHGIKSFKAQTVQDQMSTEAYNFFGSAGYLQVQRLFSDLKKIKQYYRDRGFYRMSYRDTGSPGDTRPNRTFSREGKWLIWTYTYRDSGFRLRKHEAETVVYIDVGLTEGKRTKLRSVSLRKTPPLSHTKALALLKLQPNKPFGISYLSQAVKRLKLAYEAKGYYQVKILAQCRPDGKEAVPCRRIPDLKPESVDVSIEVVSGPKVMVGEVFWRGNYRTKPGILTRDFPKSGSAFSQLGISNAQRRLRNLGIFSSVRVLTLGLKENPPRKKVALVIVVEEAPARFIDLATGFRTIDRPDSVQGDRVPPIIGSILGQSVAAADRYTIGSNRTFSLTVPDILLVLEGEYLDMNLLGTAVAMRIPIEYGFSATSPLRLLRTTPKWTIPRVFGSDLKLEIEGRFIFADRVTEVKDFTEFSTSVTATYPFSKVMSVTTQISGGMIRFEELDATERLGLFDSGYEPFVRASIRWRWDNQDNPLHPTRGFGISAALSAIIANELVDGQVEARQYMKWDLALKGALKLRPGLILAMFLRYGGSDATEVKPLPEQERFTLGKSNGLRGFGDKSLGRYDVNGNLIRPAPLNRLDIGGNVLVNFNMELRIPISKGAGLWAVGFFDAGALAADHRQLHFWNSFRSAAGFGIRYLLLNQIPLRIDLGFVLGGLRCEAYEQVEQGSEYVCSRLEDRSSLHFGFLYPF